MSEDVNPADEAEEYRWRPAVAAFRARGMRRIRSRKPLPGQMALPGIESADESPATAQRSDDGSHTIDTAEVPNGAPHPDAATRRPTCPNCGATEFDEDGDCIRCWEPHVVQGGTKRLL
jgi:hypothetical protein